MKAESELPVKGRVRLLIFDGGKVKSYEDYRDRVPRLLAGPLLPAKAVPKKLREADNLMVNVGLNILASALNWQFVQNYNAGWGSPYTGQVNLGDVYGALGTSSTAPAAGDTHLTTEIGRALLSNGGVAGPVLTLDFFFPVTVGNGTITEVGAFAQGTASSGTGTLIDHSLLGAPVVKTNTETAILEINMTLVSG
jgi:hypothetical protein